jgi:hypothetical protein
MDFIKNTIKTWGAWIDVSTGQIDEEKLSDALAKHWIILKTNNLLNS